MEAVGPSSVRGMSQTPPPQRRLSPFALEAILLAMLFIAVIVGEMTGAREALHNLFAAALGR